MDAPPTGQISSYINAPATVSTLVPSGRVRDQAAWMEEVLGRDSSRLTLVTLAKELPVQETSEARNELEGVCGQTRTVVNRVLAELRVADLARVPAGPYREAAQLHQALHAGQRRWIEELPASLMLPYLFGVLTPPEVAAQLSEVVG